MESLRSLVLYVMCGPQRRQYLLQSGTEIWLPRNSACRIWYRLPQSRLLDPLSVLLISPNSNQVTLS